MMPAVHFRRRASQGGHEILEFALVSVLFMPMFIGSFVVGMNLIRSNQANHAVRDMADMYIHGADFSDKGMQALGKRLATGLDLQVGTGTGNAADNLANSGRGIIWVSKLMWVGLATEANCQGVSPATCTNANKFVFLERIRFGNGTLETEHPSSLGHPSSATRNSYGVITDNLITNAAVQVPEPYQTNLRNLWQVTNTGLGRVPLADGQVVYVTEGYFKSPDLSLGSFQGSGVFARWFY